MGSEDPNRKKGLGARLAAIAGVIEHAFDAVGEVVQSAGELLIDNDLRRKGAQYIVEGASRSIDEAQRGIEASAQNLQAGARARIGAGARQLQNVLRNIERQIQDFQKQQQQRDLQAELEHHHKLPVDIQVGQQLLEEMPQEMRSRFWYVLLQRPDLAQALLSCSQPGTTTAGSSSSCQQQGAITAAATQAAAAGDARACSSGSSGGLQAQAAVVGASATALSSLQCSSAGGCEPTSAEVAPPLSPFASYCETPEPCTEPAAGAGACAAAAAADEPLASQPAAAEQSAPPVAAEGTADDTAEAAEAAEEGESLQEAAAVAVAEEEQAEGRLATIDRVPDIDDLLAQPSAAAAVAPEQPQTQLEPADSDAGTPEPAGAPCSAAAGSSACCDDGSSASACVDAAGAGDDDIGRFLTAMPAIAPNPWGGGAACDNRHSSGSSSSTTSSNPSAPSPWAVLSPTSATAGDAAGSAANGNTATSSSGASRGAPPSMALAAGGAAAPERSATATAAAGGEGDGWELVSRDVPSAPVNGDSSSTSGGNGVSPSELETLQTLQTLVQSLSEEALSDPAVAAQQAVFRLMAEVPWQPGAGIPSAWQQDEEYAALLEAGCGPIEEVILRDVPRTFPEHPLFAAGAEGQQRLLRVLKAYAAADPEVGYCQGMAFAAGVLLMYLPEEAAFKLYRHLMISGPRLRRLYLPGLEQLKLELARFELLLAAHSPELHAHLTAAGLPALLYAAQWLMTCYSCPFPVHVAGRVLDVLLQAGSDALLPRLGLAVMGELEEQLLALDDFEALITHIKVKPLAWPLLTHRHVINAALHSPADDAELAATSAAVEAEFRRLGRPASFSSRHITRLEAAALGGNSSSSSGSLAQELPQPAARPQSPAAAAEGAAGGAVRLGEFALQPEQEAGVGAQGEQHAAAAVLQCVGPRQAGSGSSGVLRGGEDSGVLEIDLHLLQEMDMLLVGEDGLAMSPPVSAAGGGVAAAAADEAGHADDAGVAGQRLSDA